LLRVIVSVETTFGLTLVGENAAATVGGAAANVAAPGHAPSLVPAALGVIAAGVMTPPAVTDNTVASTAPTESVTVRVTVPAAPVGTTLACAAAPPDTKVTPPLATHA
jgi:hypothetical protein